MLFFWFSKTSSNLWSSLPRTLVQLSWAKVTRQGLAPKRKTWKKSKQLTTLTSFFFWMQTWSFFQKCVKPGVFPKWGFEFSGCLCLATLLRLCQTKSERRAGVEPGSKTSEGTGGRQVDKKPPLEYRRYNSNTENKRKRLEKLHVAYEISSTKTNLHEKKHFLHQQTVPNRDLHPARLISTGVEQLTNAIKNPMTPGLRKNVFQHIRIPKTANKYYLCVLH